MFWRRTNWTHRVRLTALLTVAVSIALALVFVLIWLLLRSQALDRRFFYLERTVKRAAHEWSGPASLEEEHEDFPGIDMAVYDGDGRTVAVVGKHPPDYLLGRRRKDDRLTYGRSRDGLTFVGATSWAETEGGLGQLALVLAGLWLPLTFLTAGLSWYGGGLVLRPIRELVASAEELSGSSNDQSLTTTDTAEFASLAASLNQLIARVRHAASLQEQFATDAAHELRNPLALLRTRVEATLLRERAPVEYEAALKSQLKSKDSPRSWRPSSCRPESLRRKPGSCASIPRPRRRPVSGPWHMVGRQIAWNSQPNPARSASARMRSRSSSGTCWITVRGMRRQEHLLSCKSPHDLAMLN